MTHPNYSTALYLAAIFAAFFLGQHLDNTDHSSEWAQSSELAAVQQEEAARASREFAGRQVCGPGAVHQWEGDVLSCFPKRGKSYQVAEVK
jgi:hypothetical protein